MPLNISLLMTLYLMGGNGVVVFAYLVFSNHCICALSAVLPSGKIGVFASRHPLLNHPAPFIPDVLSFATYSKLNREFALTTVS